jgi:hypothetical protein
MKKKVAIPLAIIIVLLFWLILFYIIGTNGRKQSQDQTQAEQTQEVEVPPVLTETRQTDEPQQQALQNQPENLLMKAKLQEAPVLNGQKQRIGTRAYIAISEKDLLENVSFEDCGEFYRSFQGKNYNWVSIICPEGTGLVFPGAGPLASYGKLDRDGRLTEDIHWTITYDESTGAFKEFERDTRFLP